MEVLDMCVPYVKNVFSRTSEIFFFFRPQITQSLLHLVIPVWERSNVTVKQRGLFKYFFCYRSFRYVSTARKKVFSAATVKCFFLQGSYYSDSLVLGNANIGEIKGRSLTTTPFQKLFLLWKFQSCIYLLRRKVFSRTSEMFFPSKMLIFDGSKVTV